MERQTVVAITLQCLQNFIPAQKTALKESSSLFAEDGFLDSVNLVAFLMELEQQLQEHSRISIRLISDKALSQKQSPFRNVGSLVDFILQTQNESRDDH